MLTSIQHHHRQTEILRTKLEAQEIANLDGKDQALDGLSVTMMHLISITRPLLKRDGLSVTP